MTDAHVAWMSPVVRHRFASAGIHVWQSPGPMEPQLSTDSTMSRPPPALHASMP